MNPRIGTRLLLLGLAGLLAGGFDCANAGPAVVHNYDPADAAISGPVWAIAQTADGTLFVGSNRLSIFNGHAWQTLPLGNAYAFRALAAERPKTDSSYGAAASKPPEPWAAGKPPLRSDPRDAGRVWVGAIGDLGYVEQRPTGEWAFTSLAPQLKAAGIAKAGDIWQVHAVGEGAVFVTSDRVLRWDGRVFEAWAMAAEPHLLSFADGGDVLVYQHGRGLWRVRTQGEPALEISDALLPARPLTWLSPLQRSADGSGVSALVGLGGESHRLTARTDASALLAPRFERIENLTSALRDSVPSYAEQLDADLLAIGTYRAGVFVVDHDGRVHARIDRRSGLDDDNITALRGDHDGRLWIGHGSGFARVDGVARAAFFPHRTTFGSGLPRSVLGHEGNAFVLTSRGFFRADLPAQTRDNARFETASHLNSAPRFVPLLEAEGMLHAAAVVDDQVWIAGFGGIWRATSTGAEQEYFSATDVVQLAPTAAVPSEVLFVEGYEVKALRRTERGWASRALGARVHDTPVSLVDFAPGGNDRRSGVWVATMIDGIYHFAWSAGRGGERPTLRLAAHYRDGRGLPPGTKTPRLANIAGRLYAFADSGVLALRSDAQGFELVPEMAGFAAVAAATSGNTRQYSTDTTSWWIVQPDALTGLGTHGLLGVTSPAEPHPTLALQPTDAAGLDQVGRVAAAAVIGDRGESALWIVGTDGLLRLDSRQLRASAAPHRAGFLEVKTDETRCAIAPAAGAHKVVAWEPAIGRVSFSYTAPGAATGDAVFFQTRLAGVEAPWSPASSAMRREFTGLRHGAYTFEVRTVDRFGRVSAPALYPFTIAPPWFIRWPAIGGYAVAAMAAVGLLMRWRMVRLRRQNERLNRLVSERTRELELSNTVRAEFLENVSHEIRNPLNGLNGLLGLLQQARLAPRERDLIASLQSCARNLNRTYEEVLGFSKLEYGYIAKDERRFSLGAMLREIADGFAWHAAQQRCRITIEPAAPGQDDQFIGDANKLCTIVTNFVANAVKYAPGHPIEIKVEQHPLADDLTSVSVEVCDHGPGIPAEEQALIFQKFVRGSNAKSGSVPGTGLGLATCRVMAKALGGSVGVESEPAAGSVFFVRIPLKRAPAEATPGPNVPAEMLGHANGSHRPTALIVEDEPYNQTVLQGIVVTLGYDAAVAANAAEAAALLKSRWFDAILLDWELPGLKGGEIARHVRSAPQGEKPVIIATTGHDSDEMRRRCHEAGMDAYLLKPYDLDAIRRCISNVLLARATGHTNGDAPVPPTTSPAESTGLNLRAFDHYAAGAPGKAERAAQEFIAALEREMEMLEHAVGAGDGEEIAQCAHRVRALGGLLAATAFTEAARQLELLARPGTDDERRRAFRDLVDAGESLKSGLASRHQPAPAAGG